MSEDMNNKIKQITEILGQDNLPDNIKALLSLLSSTPTPAKDNAQPKTSEPQVQPAQPIQAMQPVQKEEKLEKNDSDDNLEIVQKVRKALDRLSTNNDPRINLLTSIRPFMNEKRQKRVSDCIKILQMAILAKLLEENDTGKTR